MSLLHQALKKAEEEKEHEPSAEVFIDQAEEEEGAPEGRTSPARLYVLIALTIGAGIFALYFEVFRKEETGLRPAIIEKRLTTPLGIAGGPGVEDLAQQADQFLREGKWQNAREVLEKWVILEPRKAEAYNNLGLSFRRLGIKEKAYEQYRKALAIDPDYPEALNNLGVLQLADGRMAEALVQFQRAVEVNPEFPEAHFHLALIDEAQGKQSSARRRYERFLELSPKLDPQFVFEIRERIDSLEPPG